MSRWATTARAAALTLAAGLLTTPLALPASAQAPGHHGADATGASETSARRAGANPVTPGDFTGYGFDQCLAPSQKSMNAWLKHSPFLSVGIYISGDSRGCRSQPNLTPGWIGKQLAKGWRLLPITLGPQASCQPRYPRYGDDETIIAKPGRHAKYGKAKKQGRREATKSVGVAQDLGIVPGSTLFYDLEGYNNANTDCRESALSFLSGWTQQLHQLGYLSGVYSSAGSGMVALDNARVQRPHRFELPDQVWIARWDGKANTSTSYMRSDGWTPHARIKQYQGGHDESWGGVRINIDRNFLDVGRGSWTPAEEHCAGVMVSRRNYTAVKPATETRTPDSEQVQALQCLLQENGVYDGEVTGVYTDKTIAAANAWQADHGVPVSPKWNRRSWMTLLSAGDRPITKYGSASGAVRRLQRALNAVSKKPHLLVDGVVRASTQSALREYQDRVGLPITGITDGKTWRALQAGQR